MHKSQKLFAGSFNASVPAILLCALVTFLIHPLAVNTRAQQKKGDSAAVIAQPTLKRTTTRHEVRRFAYGSSMTIIGAPAGSITIEAWPKSEVDISADIELYANTEEELALLAAVNSFTIDEDANHLRILTTGTHDKNFMKRAAKKFPKTLLNLPWKIDYHIRVPAMCDLEVDAGRGAISLSGVEGAISLKALESNANLVLTGGAVMATVGAGSIKVKLATRSWRGVGANIQLAKGDLTLELPAGFNADINAEVLRSGLVENSYAELLPLERTTFTPRSVRGRAGAGGATLTFKVTDGALRIRQEEK
ncbi:MAG TPA: hypothetical protein VJT09_04120 [Pyrinomonadaceae bacterium]|nr:hypothetical protein [Pyrinomonadaceae bacterium]